MASEISSVNNTRVKMWASLIDRKSREREGKYRIEGNHLVLEALKAHAPVETVIHTAGKGVPEEIRSMLGSDVELVAVSESVMAKCSDTITPQGICAIVRKRQAAANEIMAKHSSLVVVIDGVQDPGNLGTIIRSADAAGASAVLLGQGTVDLYNPKTVRSTMGSLFHLPIAECMLEDSLMQAKAQGIQIAVTTLQQAVSCYEVDYKQPTWIVVGNEGRGVSQTVLDKADVRIRIPMPGQAESLNAAMAATVLLFEAMRQRLGSARP